MADRRTELRNEIELTRESLGRDIDALESLINGTLGSVKNTVDVKSQVRSHPWIMVGAAMCAGYISGHVFRTFWRSPHGTHQPFVADGHQRVYPLFTDLLGTVASVVVRDLVADAMANARRSKYSGSSTAQPSVRESSGR